MSVRRLVKLALILGDNLPILIAAQRRSARRTIRNESKFNFDLYDDDRCWIDFRFKKNDIPRLVTALGISAELKTSNGIKFTGLEGVCILLRRLAYPQRLTDLQYIFGRSKTALSFIFNFILQLIYENHRHLVSSLAQWWLQPVKLHEYSDAIRKKGCPLPGCFGFIDGTLHKLSRPSRHQREFYSGHKGAHGLKYQSVVLPNGLIANLSGIIPGRRHDSYMLEASGLIQQLENQLGAETYYLYGDSGYPLKRFLIKPYVGHNPSAAQRLFNTTMSKLRICVEWEFGDLFADFAFLDFGKNLKLYLEPVAKYMIIGTILKNCKTCLYGSQTSSYFNLDTPTLENYISNIPE